MKNALIPISEFLSIQEYAYNLYSVHNTSPDRRLEYYKMQARIVDADYIYCYKAEIENNIVPFVYIYDERAKCIQEYRDVVKINKQIWTVGEIALAIIVYDDQIKIIDTRKPIKNKKEASVFKIVAQIDAELKKRIFEGQILEDSSADYVSLSPYQKLLKHIEVEILGKSGQIGCDIELIRRILVKFILIKYLEEQKDSNGESVFVNNYFKQFINIPTRDNVSFCDVLRKGDCVKLLNALNDKFNGGIFKLTQEEARELSQANFDVIANALDGNVEPDGQLSIWRYYDFSLLPIEFISRLYERFVISVAGKQKATGAYYTPPHLASLLIDELLPFDKLIDFENTKILDPSCGSGVFLVLAYKRLITLWMLAKGKKVIEGIDDINAIKKILSDCIYGIDINEDALSITATSLQIELTSHIQPKEIWENLRFDNLETQGNLTKSGFFKWCRQNDKHFNIIVGNPPFNILREELEKNIALGEEDDYRKLRYVGIDNKQQSFPDQNPALAFLYIALEKLLIPEVGNLFMIMPSSTLLYMPTSHAYRKMLVSRWNIKKIYDFTPLKSHLWGKTKIATVAVYIKNDVSYTRDIEHILVRNTTANKKGAVRFQIDKYDKYKVPANFIFNKDFIWKVNLLGGGFLGHYIERYQSNYKTLGDFFRNNDIKGYVGYQKDKVAKNKINLKGQKILVSKRFDKDKISDSMMEREEKNEYVRIVDDISFYTSPIVLIRLNINKNIPIAYYRDAELLLFPKGILGIKGKDPVLMDKFITLFKKNRELYKVLIKATGPKIFVQQDDAYSIEARDIMKLPINLDSEGQPIPFPSMDSIKQAVIEDTELRIKYLNDIDSPLFEPVDKEAIDAFNEFFCRMMNYTYEKEGMKFRPIRRIITDSYVWVTFEYNSIDRSLENQSDFEDKIILDQILTDDCTNNGLVVNRIITYFGEANRISFVKPNKFKYWMNSIAYRDAENVKAQMFKQGY